MRSERSSGSPAVRVAEAVRARRGAFVELTKALALLESPSDVPALQDAVFDRLGAALESAGYRTRRYPGATSGGLLTAVPVSRRHGSPFQLVLGHADTVWPVGTLNRMPVVVEHDTIRGPGTFDMKAGLAMAVTAFAALADAGLEPLVTPVLFVNSDEEVDSVESRPGIIRFARRADRVLVLEPALGLSGRLKSARPGTALYHVTVLGRAAHAGLARAEGRSAILAMTDLVREVDALNDADRGILVNVGTVAGGIRRNVVAPDCRFSVDVRTRSRVDALHLDARIRSLASTRDGIEVRVEGTIERPPFEGTAMPHRPLLDRALELAASLGLDPGHGFAGGASDGNDAAPFAPTLDGLGAVGDGAHAEHEFVDVDASVRRIMLLALLLLEPPYRDSLQFPSQEPPPPFP